MSNKNHWVGPGALLFATFLAVLGFNTSNTEFQGVDAQSRNQPLICDGLDRIITFPNFVTAQVWLDQIRWEKSGSYTFGMEYDVGEKVALSYQCTKT